MRFLSFLLLLLLFTTPSFAKTLTLSEAVSLAAHSDDPLLAQMKAKAKSFEEKSVADEQLPDPKISAAFQNFPTDNLSRSREGMTQIVVGASQAFPRGKTLIYKSQKTGAMAMAEKAKRLEGKLTIIKSVRQTWLDLYYREQAIRTIEESERLLKKVIKATEMHYGTGRRKAQDVIAAELELSLLQDKKVEVERQIELAQAELAKWIGQNNARRSLPKKFPHIPNIKSFEVIKGFLPSHPKIKISAAMVEAGKRGVKIAEEQYKPGFNMGVNYGMRSGNLSNGASRPDLVTAKLTLDVPFFTGKKQNRNLKSSRYEVMSAQYSRDDSLRSLKLMLDKEYANWRRFDQRAKNYNRTVIKQANENFEASLNAYQEARTDFSSLIRAQVMAFDTKLKGLKFKVDKAKAQVALLYLQGENL